MKYLPFPRHLLIRRLQDQQRRLARGWSSQALSASLVSTSPTRFITNSKTFTENHWRPVSGCSRPSHGWVYPRHASTVASYSTEDLTHQVHVSETRDWDALLGDTRGFQQDSRQSVKSGHAWTPAQWSEVQALLQSWQRMTTTTTQEQREQAVICTQLLQLCMEQVASAAAASAAAGDFDNSFIHRLLENYVQTLQLWNQQTLSFSEALGAVQLLKQFQAQAVPALLKLDDSPSELCDVVDKAYTLAFDILACHPKELSTLDHVEDLWEDRTNQSDSLGREPNILVWMSLIRVASQCSPSLSDGLERVQDFWEEMIEMDVEPNEDLYLTLLETWAQSARPDAGEQAQAILNDSGMAQKSIACVDLVLSVWAKSGHPEKAEELLFRHLAASSKEYQESNQESLVMANRQSFLTVISGWSHSTRSDAGKRAEKLMSMMHDLYEIGNEAFKPDVDVYNAVLGVWAAQPNSGERVETVLKHLQSAAVDLPPLYLTAITAWENTDSEDAPLRAHNLLEEIRQVATATGLQSEMLSPTLYLRTIQCWTAHESLDGPDRAFEILEMMTQDGISPDTAVYNAAIHACAQYGLTGEAESLLKDMQQEAERGNEQAAPNVTSYISMLNAYVNNEDPQSQERGRKLLQEMEFAFDNGKENLRPDEYVYVTLIHLIGKVSADDASLILDHMAERYNTNGACPAPGTKVCNAVLRAWAYSKDGVAPQRTKSLLEWMKQQSKSHEGIEPDKVTYQFAIQTWIQSRRKIAPEEIELLLADMVEQGLIADDESLRAFQLSLRESPSPKQQREDLRKLLGQTN